MKVFISFPMNGKSYDELVKERNSIINQCKLYFSEDTYYIDTVFDDSDYDYNDPLYYLGKSITAMAEADIVVFARGWENARGCLIEYDCARKYGVPILTI